MGARVLVVEAHLGDAQNIAFVTQTARADGEKIGASFAEAFHRIVVEGSIARVQDPKGFPGGCASMGSVA